MGSVAFGRVVGGTREGEESLLLIHPEHEEKLFAGGRESRGWQAGRPGADAVKAPCSRAKHPAPLRRRVPLDTARRLPTIKSWLGLVSPHGMGMPSARVPPSNRTPRRAVRRRENPIHESISVNVSSRERWHHTGVNLDTGSTYRLTLPPGQHWWDWYIRYGPEGGVTGWISKISTHRLRIKGEGE